MAKYPLIKTAKVQKGMLGGYVAIYPCPYCKEELTSKEQEIGEPDSCPHCRGIFKLDEGLTDRIEAKKSKAQEEKQRKVQEKQEAKERASQERLEKEELRRKQLVEQSPSSPLTAVSTHSSPAVPQPREQPATAVCPYCKESIVAGSVKCKHCGEYLDQKLRDARAPKVKQWEPVVALILSFIVPGAGQLYKGQVLNALAWFFITIIGYFFFIIPGLILHTICVIGAALGDPYKK